MKTEAGGRTDAFTTFVTTCEPRLRRALVATYGPGIGRDATVDALSWAWENWTNVGSMQNPVGYLYRVGQTAARRHLAVRPLSLPPMTISGEPDTMPELAPALTRLSDQQRAVVVLVHGYAISQREVAELLDIAVSTVREHLARGMTRLRNELEDRDEH